MKRIAPVCPLAWFALLFGFAAISGCGPTTPDPPQSPCASVTPGDLIITEFMPDPAGSDTGKQYIEIYNQTDDGIELGGLTLFQSMADGSRENATTLRKAALPSHGYFVLGDAGNNAQARPAYLGYGYGSEIGALRHDNTRLGLRCAAAVVAEAEYAQVTAGRARELDGNGPPGKLDVLSAANWCDATEPLDALLPPGENYGSPGAPNLPCARTRGAADDGGLAADHLAQPNGDSTTEVETEPTGERCFDVASGSRRPIQSPVSGDLLLTEVMPAPSVGNNAGGEWFEVLATRNVDLNGVLLENESSAGTVLGDDTCLTVTAGSWLLFARSDEAAQNGGLPSVTAVFDFTLADSASANYSERALALRIGEHLIDRVTWSKSSKGTALQRSSGGSLQNAAVEWCPALAEASFGAGDHGTPAAANLLCPQPSDAGASTSAPPSPNGGASSITSHSSNGIGGRPEAATGTTSSLWQAGGTSSCGGSGGVPTTDTTFTGTGGVPSVPSGGFTQFSSGGAGGAPVSTSESTAISGSQCTDVDGIARALVAPRPGDLVITELMSAPSANNNGAAEWFEVLVNCDLDLNGIEFGNEGTGRRLLASDACIRVYSGERLVFARGTNFDDNGGLPLVSETFSFTLADSASETHPERMLLLSYDGVVLSRVAWTKSSKGASWQRSESASPASDAGVASEDASTAMADLWCVTPADVIFGLGDRGTPGSRNQPCE